MNEDLYQMYLEEIEGITPCTNEENEALLVRLVSGDKGVKNRLVEGNLKAALSYIENYKDKGIVLNDLVQEANVALMLAVESYEKGSLENHLETEIKKALHEAVGAQEMEAKVEEEIVARINVLGEVSKRMAEELGREATIEELAERMKMTVDEIQDIMKLTLEAMSVVGE